MALIERGFYCLTGEVGTGKTTLTKTLIEHLPQMFVLGIFLIAVKGIRPVCNICKDLSIRLEEIQSLSLSNVLMPYMTICSKLFSQGLKTYSYQEAQNLDDEIWKVYDAQ